MVMPIAIVMEIRSLAYTATEIVSIALTILNPIIAVH